MTDMTRHLAGQKLAHCGLLDPGKNGLQSANEHQQESNPLMTKTTSCTLPLRHGATFQENLTVVIVKRLRYHVLGISRLRKNALCTMEFVLTFQYMCSDRCRLHHGAMKYVQLPGGTMKGPNPHCPYIEQQSQLIDYLYLALPGHITVISTNQNYLIFIWHAP